MVSHQPVAEFNQALNPSVHEDCDSSLCQHILARAETAHS